MFKIPVGDSFAIVDEEDFKIQSQHTWYMTDTGYAIRNLQKVKGEKSCRKVTMHREIINCPVGLRVDHINENRLDNRKCNLRIRGSKSHGSKRTIENRADL